MLDVCEYASANENNAKVAVRALCREFKYADPSAQLAVYIHHFSAQRMATNQSHVRLWALMFRNSSPIFITYFTSRKFLNAVEDLLTSPRTSAVVCEHVMAVLPAHRLRVRTR